MNEPYWTTLSDPKEREAAFKAHMAAVRALTMRRYPKTLAALAKREARSLK